MSTLARVVFALLVAATFGAFFVSQKLKNAESVAEYTKLRHYFSPNGDGVRDRDRITFKVEKADRLTITVVNLAGDRVRRLATGVDARPERPVTVVWDGRSDDGIRAPDGRYRLQVGLRRTGRTVTIPGAFNVDTTAPKPVVVSVKPATAGPVAGAFQIHARRVGSLRAPRFRILRTDLGPPKEVARFLGRKGSQSARVGRQGQRPCPRRPGSTWSSSASATRPATSAPRPPCCRRFPARSAASRASPSVSSRRSRPWWRCAPASASRSTSTRATAPTAGTSAGWAAARSRRAAAAAGKRTLVLRSPRGASGVYLLQVRSGSSRTRVPFLVQSPERSKLLVVVPTASWLGVDKIDDDRDGLPNTLENGGPVEWPRAYTRLPPALAADTAPLLIFLDRAGIKYDLTSDIALARSDEPTANRPGVILAGSLRWIPRSLARRLRRYVESGGRVASFGTESMRRGMRITDDVLSRPTQATPTDPFGARLEPVAVPRTEDDGRTPLPLTALTEDSSLGLLTGSDGTLGAFGRLEESAKRPDTPNAKLLTALGQDVSDSERTKAEAKGELPREALPVLAATRLGKGIEIRVGLTEWAQRANRDREVGQITHNIVDILRHVTPKIQ